MRQLLATLTLFVTLTIGAVPALAEPSAAETYQRSYDFEAVGKYADALGTFELVPAAAKDTYTYHLRHGWLLYLMGKYGPAVDAYKLAIAKAPGAVEPQLGLLMPLIAARRFTEASTAALTVLKLDPKNNTALGKLAWARYNEGRFQDAADAYKRSLADYPSDVDMRAGLGWSYLKLGRANEAITELRAVLEVAPKHATAKAGLQQLGQ